MTDNPRLPVGELIAHYQQSAEAAKRMYELEREQRIKKMQQIEKLEAELVLARELYQNTIELCREAEKYVNYYEPSFLEFAVVVRRWAAENRAILDRVEK